MLVAGSEQNSDSYPTRASCRRRRSQLREGHIFFLFVVRLFKSTQPFRLGEHVCDRIPNESCRVKKKKDITSGLRTHNMNVYAKCIFKGSNTSDMKKICSLVLCKRVIRRKKCPG